MLFVDEQELEGLGRARQVPERVDELVDKYMGILGVDVAPVVAVQDNLGSKWLGKTLWTTRNPSTTKIVLQKAILDDDLTLERVVAHEMIHHVEMLELTPADVQKIRMGIKPRAHGVRFLELAREVNEQMGNDFVTVESDQSYAVASTREFVVVVMKMPGGANYGYVWASRPTPRMLAQYLRLQDSYGAVMVKTDDLRWTEGAKLGDRRRIINVPRSSEDQAKLQELYEGSWQAMHARARRG